MAKKAWSKLLLLRQWRSIIHEAANIIKRMYPEAEIYLIGGAAENRLTIYSDIDVIVVFKRKLNRRERTIILARIWEALEEKIPIYYPLEIQILENSELAKIRGRKIKIT